MKIKVADLVVEVKFNYDFMLSRLEPYYCDQNEKADIVIDLTEEFYINRHKDNPQMTLGECESLWSSAYFYEQLTRFGGMMLHSSCVEYEGKAYLFSARSGTGKSTHTHLWLKYLPGARIINDDKPAIRCIDGVYYAYGTPWSGKTDESVNIGVPIAGIAFLSRGENSIKRIPGIKALKPFMDQTIRPRDKALMGNVLDILNGILTEIPIYEMSCDMSEEAVLTAYNGMKGACNG